MMPIREPFMFANGRDLAFYTAFLIVAALGGFYVYVFIRSLFQK